MYTYLGKHMSMLRVTVIILIQSLPTKNPKMWASPKKLAAHKCFHIQLHMQSYSHVIRLL